MSDNERMVTVRKTNGQSGEWQMTEAKAKALVGNPKVKGQYMIVGGSTKKAATRSTNKPAPAPAPAAGSGDKK